MTAVDSSVVVAAFASWHEAHAAARDALSESPRLPAHVALEACSVLTRLPPPHRADAPLVVSFLERRFPDAWLQLTAERHRELLRQATEAGVSGGALYDALIAVTAKDAGAMLLTRDRRAARTYEALGAAFTFVE